MKIKHIVILVAAVLSLIVIAALFHTAPTSSRHHDASSSSSTQLLLATDVTAHDDDDDGDGRASVGDSSNPGSSRAVPFLHRHQAMTNNAPFGSPQYWDNKIKRILQLGQRTAFEDSLLPSQDCGESCMLLDGSVVSPCPEHNKKKKKSMPCGVFLFSSKTESAADSAPAAVCRVLNGKYSMPVCTGSVASWDAEIASKPRIPFREYDLKSRQFVVSSSEKNTQHQQNQPNEELNAFVRDACRYDHHRKSWRPGAGLRAAVVPSMQVATDCCLPSSPTAITTVTAHHMTKPQLASPQRMLIETAARYTAEARASGAFKKVGDIIGHLNHNNNKRQQQQTPDGAATISATEYRRFARASWVRVNNVCMTCEKSSSSKTFLNPKRKCHATLWSIDDGNSVLGRGEPVQQAVKRLAAKSRNGRHSMFYQREASFIYGGSVSSVSTSFARWQSKVNPKSSSSGKSDEKNNKRMTKLFQENAEWVKGSTWYLPSFSVPNVGHAIHDGMLGFVGSLLAREALKKAEDADASSGGRKKMGSTSNRKRVPRPWRVMIDDDFFEASSPMYSFVMSAVALHGLREENTVGEINRRAGIPNDVQNRPEYLDDVASDSDEIAVGAEDAKHTKKNSKHSSVMMNPVADLANFREDGGDDDGGGGDNRNTSHGNKKKKMLCFEQLILSGGDRTGNDAKFVTKQDVARSIRVSVFRYLTSVRKQQQERGNQPAASSWLLPLPPPVATPPCRSIRIFVYGRSDLYRRAIDNFGALVHAVRGAVEEVRKDNKAVRHNGDSIIDPSSPVLVTTWYGGPASQVALASSMDILVTAQGAHEQTVSLFGAADMSIIEVSPCQGLQTSFVGKYGMFLSSSASSSAQRLIQVQVCAPAINFCDDDVTEQNVTLCPHQLKLIQNHVVAEVERIRKSRSACFEKP